MTAINAGALVNDTKRWKSIDWDSAHRNVRRLQMRIAKAVQEGRQGRVKALQWLLTHSYHAKLLAVKRVTSNKGRKTPGVDGVLWKSARYKMQAVRRLKRHSYIPLPLKRIYIPKKNGKKRPLSIPTMKDRAMQALHKLALAPVAETTADPNSYGFREGRSCADANAQCFNALSHRNSATWVLEADIKGCFDNISFKWMLDNIPMDKQILQKWLKTGYIEKGVAYSSRKGTPQGGIISPTLMNMTLDGLEQTVHNSIRRKSRVNFIRYADDFIVTGKSKRILEEQVRPAIEAFLSERGLTLSEEKTAITHIRDGFDFLGQSFRKHQNTLHITPSQEGVNALIAKIGAFTRKYHCVPIVFVIKKLNHMLRGWGNYHRHVVSSKAFAYVDWYVYDQLWRMIRRRHPNKSKGWLIKKYWTATGRKWIFSIYHKYDGKLRLYQVIKVSSIKIRRHLKIKAKANPYLPEYAGYFWRRRNNKESKLLPAMSARELRAMAALDVNSRVSP